MKSHYQHLVVLCLLALGLTAGSALAAEKSSPKAAAAPAAAPAVEKRLPYTSPVDLNAGTREQLLTIVELSPEQVDKIIENRPYREKIALRRQDILPADVFYQVMEKLVIDPVKWKRLYEKKLRQDAAKKN